MLRQMYLFHSSNRLSVGIIDDKKNVSRNARTNHDYVKEKKMKEEKLKYKTKKYKKFHNYIYFDDGSAFMKANCMPNLKYSLS